MIKISVNYLNKNLQFSVINLKQNTSENKNPSPKASCIIDESLLSSVVKTSWALLTDQVINYPFVFVFFVFVFVFVFCEKSWIILTNQVFAAFSTAI